MAASGSGAAGRKGRGTVGARRVPAVGQETDIIWDVRFGTLWARGSQQRNIAASDTELTERLHRRLLTTDVDVPRILSRRAVAASQCTATCSTTSPSGTLPTQ